MEWSFGSTSQAPTTVINQIFNNTEPNSAITQPYTVCIHYNRLIVEKWLFWMLSLFDNIVDSSTTIRSVM